MEESIWSEYILGEGDTRKLSIGRLNLWIRRYNEDWLIGEEKDVDIHAGEGVQDPVDGLEWRRWPNRFGNDKITVKPVLPDKSLLVKTRMPFQLPPGVETTFYVSVPVFLSLSLSAESQAYELCQIPSIVLSNSWFGDFFEGELCYALKSSAKRDLENAVKEPHIAVCPFRVCNQSDGALPIQKICLRPQFLNIYAGSFRMWTDEVKVTFRGDGLPSKIDYAGRAPDILGDPILLQSAKEKPEDNFFKKTFGDHMLNPF